MNKISQLIGAILLVSGTTIGAGILALPISTGLCGFLGAFFLLVLVWLFMSYTALLFLEVNLWMEEESNLISMAKKTLGKTGEIFSWLTYLFLLYALTTAYMAGSAPLFLSLLNHGFNVDLPNWVGVIPLLLIFSCFVYIGIQAVDKINRLLMIGMAITFFWLTFMVFPHVDTDALIYYNPSYLRSALSVIVTSFGFHIIIPTLTTYLKRDVNLIKKGLLIGSLIPFLAYLIWEIMTLGVVPLAGKYGIINGYAKGYNSSYLLAKILENPLINQVSASFCFFVISTSFLGVSMSLSDFLSDGLKIKKTFSGKLLLYALTFVPPFLITISYPRAFLSALEYAGAFGVITLLALLPALMVWQGRYRQKITGPYRAPGGRFSLIFVMVISILIIFIEMINKTGYLERV